MISVVIATQNQARLIGSTLAALVPAAVDGVVRQVIVADGGSSDETLDIAKDSGADVLELDGSIEARLAAGCGRAKADWLLILDPSVSPPAGWEAAAREHIDQRSDQAAWFAPTRGGLLGGPPKAHGLLVSRAMLAAAGGYSEGLARKLGARLSRLKPANTRF